MKTTRAVDRVIKSKPTTEGAGVRLKRAFGPVEASLLDPFLLLDDFHSANPDDYMVGFPFHPHRGIETVTYVIRGVIEHRDTIGNKGVINSGDVQWMTAGSGILHQEMPQRHDGMMQGFQLWVNLPASMKMMKPRYREVKSRQIPSISPSDGVQVKIIAGRLEGQEGPIRDLVVEVEYLDVAIQPHKVFSHQVKRENSTLAYVFEGDGFFDPENAGPVRTEHLVIFKKGDVVDIKAGEKGIRFLLVSGRPIREPIAWGGPIVMNTQEELDLAFKELQEGEFIKNG
ncbi:MAG: pirin family protein [Methanomassiliicoccales archaeon]|nr:pirin family protein [Methanomassiliicoccales archaeon]